MSAHQLSPIPSLFPSFYLVVSHIPAEDFLCYADLQQTNGRRSNPRSVLVQGQPTAFSEGFIFSFGGFKDTSMTVSTSMDVVEKFDPTAVMWTEVAPMRGAKSYMEAVAVGGKIYALGGYGGDGNILSTVECYDVTENQWTTFKPMNRARMSLRAFTINGSIFAVGGYGEQYSIERYDIAKDEWKMVKVPAGLDIQESVRVTIPQ